MQVVLVRSLNPVLTQVVSCMELQQQITCVQAVTRLRNLTVKLVAILLVQDHPVEGNREQIMIIVVCKVICRLRHILHMFLMAILVTTPEHKALM